MAVFKRNLTSSILEKETLKIISKKKSIISVLELGCGNGNISQNLASKHPKNNYSASDISKEAIDQAISSSKAEIKFVTCNGIDAWIDQKFDLVICDISAISQKIANLSDWYDGVSCKTGVEGLDLVAPVIKNVGKILNQGGVFIIPVISLCNVTLQKELLKENFSSVEYSKKVNWPMPKELLLDMHNHSINLDSSFLDLERKFDLVLASTCAAVCYL
jgi:methylase of polypeptide subunit release factors